MVFQSYQISGDPNTYAKKLKYILRAHLKEMHYVYFH